MRATILKITTHLAAVGGAFVLTTSGASDLTLQRGAVPAARTGADTAQVQFWDQDWPAGLRPAVYKTLSQDGTAPPALDAHGCTALHGGSLRACFRRDGAHFTRPHAPALDMRLTGIGRGDRLVPTAPVLPEIAGAVVSYPHHGYTEWWHALPVGFEQGFTLTARPQGSGQLVLQLAASGTGRERAGAVTWGKLHYGGLEVTDARGKRLPASLRATADRRLLIAVDDAHAAYPVTVDPLVWIEQKVAASDGQADDLFGYASLVTGNTAFISAPAPGFRPGKVYVYTYAAGSWSKSQVLTAMPAPSDGTPPNWADFFGWSLAASGTTLVVGAPFNFNSMFGPVGAAYVFTESGGTWTQQQELDASDGATNDWVGNAVGISGNTAMVGAYNHNGQGTVYVFTNSGGTWGQAQELVGSDSASHDGREFGFALAFDGTNLLVGAPGPDSTNGTYPVGTVYTFAASGGTWGQTQELNASDGVQGDQYGFSLALSGSSALVGAPHAAIGSNTAQGAAYTLVQSSGTWAEQQKLTPSDGAAFDQFGLSVALQGGTALVGEWSRNENSGGHQPPPKAGIAYEFTSAGGTWTQAQEFTASDATTGDSFGWSVGLDGGQLLVGAQNNVNGNTFQGSAYFYPQASLSLALSAPQFVATSGNFTSTAVLSNAGAADSSAATLTFPVPAGATYVSASATQGSCTQTSGIVSCALGTVAASGGSATVSVVLSATGSAGTVVQGTASLVSAVPGLSATASSTISQPPVANDGSLSVDEDASGNGTLAATAPSGTTLMFAISSQPQHGSVSLQDANKGTYTYTPAQGYTGSDSFGFAVNDGELSSNAATVSVTVKAVSTTPPPSGGGGGGGGGGGSGSSSGGGTTAPLALALLALTGLARRRRGDTN